MKWRVKECIYWPKIKLVLFMAENSRVSTQIIIFYLEAKQQSSQFKIYKNLRESFHIRNRLQRLCLILNITFSTKFKNLTTSFKTNFVRTWNFWQLPLLVQPPASYIIQLTWWTAKCFSIADEVAEMMWAK